MLLLKSSLATQVSPATETNLTDSVNHRTPIRVNTITKSRVTLPNFKISESKEASEVCRVLLEEGKWGHRLEEALIAFVPKLQNTVLARILKQQRDPSMALQLFKWAELQPCFTHDSFTYYALIEVLGKSDCIEPIWAVLDQMRMSGIRIKPVPFTFIIAGYGRSGLIREAELAFHSMREFHCKPNVFTYNAMLFSLLKTGNVERAVFTYRKMIKLHCSPDITTFNTLISGLCLNNRVEDALFVLDEMLKREYRPDIRIFNTLIRSFLKLGSPERAIKIYELALANGCEHSTVTYTVLLDWFFKNGNISEATRLFREMLSCGCHIDAFVSTTVVSGLFNAGEVVTGLSVFSDLVKNGCTNVSTFNVVIDWFCKDKQMDKAVELVLEMEQNGFTPDTYTHNSLIKGWFGVGAPEIALDLINQMNAKGCSPDMVTYSLIIQFLCREGQIDDALLLLQEMHRNGYEPDAVIYNHILLASFKSNEHNLAMGIATSMIENGCALNDMTHSLLIRYLPA